MRINKNKKIYGFTLVELLIVVAIIGVLATIGIPTFRIMVQKAKKSEAKVGLGGLYTSENAFFAEYGAYGGNLAKIGFEVDGTATNRIYVMGFTVSGCTGSTTDMPTVASNQGTAINSTFPGYYTAGAIGAANQIIPVTSNPPLGSCYAATVTSDGHDFIAGASGIIAPNISDQGQTAGEVDQWSMTRMRFLTNVVDGVK